MAKRTIEAPEVIAESITQPPVEVQRPAEEPDGQKVIALMETILADAATRSAHTDESRAWLADLEPLTVAFVQKAESQYRDEEMGCAPQATSALVIATQEFVNINLANYRMDLGVGLDVETPSIESATIRNLLVKKGQELISEVNAAIAEGYARLARIEKRRRALREQMRYWLQRAGVRSLILAVIELDKDRDVFGNALGHVLDAVSSATRMAENVDARSGLNPPPALATVAGFYRRWLPTAIEIVNEELKAERSAA